MDKNRGIPWGHPEIGDILLRKRQKFQPIGKINAKFDRLSSHALPGNGIKFPIDAITTPASQRPE
jgi:hypothetical protein